MSAYSIFAVYLKYFTIVFKKSSYDLERMDSKDFIVETKKVTYGEIKSLTQSHVTDPRSHVP